MRNRISSSNWKITHSPIKHVLVIFICTFYLPLTSVYADTFKINPPIDSILGFELGLHSLEEVQTKLGRTNLSLPTEAEPLIKACYKSISKNDSEKLFVVFEAMGQKSSLMAFAIMANTNDAPEKERCLETEMISKESLIVGELHIGMTKGQLIRLLGKPSKIQGRRSSYIYESKKKMNDEEIKKMDQQWSDEIRSNPYWDVVTTLRIEFARNKVIFIGVNKTETY